MKHSPLNRLTSAYLASLQAHCAQTPPASLAPAVAIGREAVALGLETLDLAKIHATALGALLVPGTSPAVQADLTARAATFFTEALTPIEETHRAALNAASDLNQLHAGLDQILLKLADANAALQRQVAERSEAENTLRHSLRFSDQLIEDSQALERNLQDMTRQILAATEGERRKMSLQLNDEVAQTLLAIHLRILALHQEVAAKHAAFAQEIATTRQFVADSAKTINRLADELSSPQEA